MNALESQLNRSKITHEKEDPVGKVNTPMASDGARGNDEPSTDDEDNDDDEEDQSITTPAGHIVPLISI